MASFFHIPNVFLDGRSARHPHPTNFLCPQVTVLRELTKVVWVELGDCSRLGERDEFLAFQDPPAPDAPGIATL